MISDSKLLASAAWDAQSLNELKAKAGEDPAANIRPVARQVEGMFVQMMLKSMRDALPKDGLFSSEHTRLYTSMYDQQIAQQMTAGKGLGLAERMVKQMTPEQPLPEESTPAAPMKFPLETVVRYQNQALSQLVQKAVPRNYDDSLPGNSKAFLAQLSLPAQLASQQSGVPHHLILAQAALESGWGQRQIRRENGEPSYNLFGVKASGNWKGRSEESKSEISGLQLVSGSIVGLRWAVNTQSALRCRDDRRECGAGGTGPTGRGLCHRSSLCPQTHQHDSADEIDKRQGEQNLQHEH